MTPADAETPPAMLSVSGSYHNAPLSQVNGTSSLLGDIPSPAVLTCVVVFSGDEQEVFWRRACLRVTCVPVTNTSGRHREAAAEASRIAEPSISLDEIRDGACSSSCSNSGRTGCASGKKLNEFVWRWLDTLGMTDAVEDVLSPGAGRLSVVWTAGVMYEQDSRGGALAMTHRSRRQQERGWRGCSVSEMVVKAATASSLVHHARLSLTECVFYWTESWSLRTRGLVADGEQPEARREKEDEVRHDCRPLLPVEEEKRGIERGPLFLSFALKRGATHGAATGSHTYRTS